MNNQSPNRIQQEPTPKKKSHWKGKLFAAIIAIIVLVGIGIYIGSHFQKYYYSFVFSASHSIMTFAFWAIIVLIAIIAIYIVYLVLKAKKK